MKYRIHVNHRWVCPDGTLSKEWEKRRLFDTPESAVMYVRLLGLREADVYQDFEKPVNNASDEERIFYTT